MVATGLVCAVTRSAWLGAAVAIFVLALAMKQTKRLAFYATLALALFAASIPILGLSDYLFFTKTGQDPSAEWRKETIVTGIQYIVQHPLGTGAGSIGGRALDSDKNALVLETSYLAFGGQYGIIALLCFLGFLLTAFRLLWRERSSLSYAASGIMIAFAFMMIFFILHTDFRLNCWAWFPVGLAVRSATTTRDSLPRY
jgi:O-antigen ligase